MYFIVIVLIINIIIITVIFMCNIWQTEDLTHTLQLNSVTNV